MTSPTLKLLYFDLTLRRKHSAGTSIVSALPSREVEKTGKSLMAGKLSWQQRERQAGWGHRTPFGAVEGKSKSDGKQQPLLMGRGEAVRLSITRRADQRSHWRLLEVGPIHFLTYIRLFPSNSPLLHLDKMSHIPGPSFMWFSILVLKTGRMWSNSHICHWVCAFMLARNIDLRTETQSIHTHIHIYMQLLIVV